MINLSKKTTGEQVYKLVVSAIKKRKEKNPELVAGKKEFARISGVSRSQLHRYKQGENPTLDSLAKLAKGFRAWGYTVTLKID